MAMRKSSPKSMMKTATVKVIKTTSVKMLLSGFFIAHCPLLVRFTGTTKVDKITHVGFLPIALTIL